MKGVIETLKFTDSNGEKYNLYPRTLIECISNQNGDSLEDTLQQYVDAQFSDTYADKTYVAEQIAASNHLIREIVTEIPTAETAKDNVIYMYKVDSASGNDVYQEYQLIGGEVVLVGDTSIDLNDYVKSETLDNIIDGTTPVGDSNKLGGKGAGEYALSKFHGVGDNGRPYMSYVPTNTPEKKTLIQVEDGLVGVYITTDNGTTWNFERLATTADLANYLPIDGSKPITGNIFKWFNGYSGLTGSSVHSAIVSFPNSTDTNNSSAIVVYNESANIYDKLLYQVKKDGVDTNYSILHTGNKPTGTYTGNGSATERTINTGGIGNALLVIGYNSTGQNTSVIVTPTGAFGSYNGSVNASGYVVFNNGVYTLATNDSALNANGGIYTYQVL